MFPPGSLRASERNYYELLGVSKNASRDEIRKAFHEVMLCYCIGCYASIGNLFFFVKPCTEFLVIALIVSVFLILLKLQWGVLTV